MRFRLLLASLALSVIFASATARAATPQQVDQAIAKAKAYLYSQQNNGNWEDIKVNHHENDTGSVTALVTYSLLASGEAPKNPKLMLALDYLKGADMKTTYGLGLRCQVWLNCGDPLPRPIQNLLGKDAQVLLKAAHPSKDAPGSAFYTYTVQGEDMVNHYDHSNSQVGVLGIWACADAGGEIPTAYWQAVEKGWRAHQNPDGGWMYKTADAPGEAWEKTESLSMTSAGIATLFLCDQWTHADDGVACKGNVADPEIEKGLKWMGEHAKSIANLNGVWGMYTAYGIERIGVASGLKYLGDTDWYKLGADHLVQIQEADGSIGGDVKPVSTALALLFLSRGRAPVVMNKLEYQVQPPADGQNHLTNWNQRPRDAANVTKYIGKQLEQYLNWQTVNLKVPPEDLHDAPILYLSGNQELNLSDADIATLRTFVQEGGMILGNADCDSKAFADSFEQLGHKIAPDYEFRALPKDSPIYTNEQFHPQKWPKPVEIRALSNGVRELMILFPKGDPGRFWQTQTVGGHEQLFQSLANIFLYAVDKQNLRNKGETYIVTARGAAAPSRMSVARIQYSGNWDPEPGGWRQLAAVMHNDHQLDLDVKTVQLGQAALKNEFPLAHMTGTAKFTLSGDQRKELVAYVNNGGTLLIDAAGGQGDFTHSAETELAAIFPNAKFKNVQPSDHCLAGPTPLEVAFRPFAVKAIGASHKLRLRAMEVNGRDAVFLSGEDLSGGLVGEPMDGIIGYEPKTATEIVSRLLLYANAGKTQASAATKPVAAP